MPRSRTQLPATIEDEAARVTRWLRAAKAARSSLRLKDRFDLLLWSWPLRRLLTTQPPRPFWREGIDNIVFEYRRRRSYQELDQLAGAWYPVVPIAASADRELEDRCRQVWEELGWMLMCDLIVPAAVPLGDDESPQACLAHLLEAHWGDGRRDYRAEMQHEIVAKQNDSRRRRICAIGEQARDAGYLSVQKSRSLDAFRTTKEGLGPLHTWLQQVEKQQDTVERLLNDKFAQNDPTLPEDLAAIAAGLRMIAGRQVTAHLDLLQHSYTSQLEKERRDRRPSAGRPPRPWIGHADRALQAFLSPLDREDLLKAWGLIELKPQD